MCKGVCGSAYMAWLTSPADVLHNICWELMSLCTLLHCSAWLQEMQEALTSSNSADKMAEVHTSFHCHCCLAAWLQEMQDALTSSEEEKNALKRQLAKLSKKYQQVGWRYGSAVWYPVCSTVRRLCRLVGQSACALAGMEQRSRDAGVPSCATEPCTGAISVAPLGHLLAPSPTPPTHNQPTCVPARVQYKGGLMGRPKWKRGKVKRGKFKRGKRFGRHKWK